MKRLLLLALFVTFAATVSTQLPAFGEAESSKEQEQVAASDSVVQTECKITHTLANGDAGMIASPTIRSFSGVPATVEIEIGDGQKLKLELTANVLAEAARP
tara:strand:+ start:18032 stop:18337 length:306 start_codon:yes stop_codon:yes gene_type:complete